MSNHFHLLLELPPMPKRGLSDEEFFRRLEVVLPGLAGEGGLQCLETAREAGNGEEL